MTVTKGFIHTAQTPAIDTRKADELKLVASAAGVARLGVLSDNPSIVTSDASTAPMRVAVAKAGFATQRVAGDGVALWGNDGSIFVTVTKPGSNSWYVTVYAKHNDTAAGDGTSLPEINVVTGAASATPVEAALPSGALKLATILIPSTATSTQSAGVIITNVYPMTVFRGGTVPFRTKAEADAAAAFPVNTLGNVFADSTTTNNGIYRWSGTAWLASSGPGILMRRGATAGNIVTASYTAIYASTFWVEENRLGFVAYANGATIPLSGIYRVSYGVATTTEGILAGVAVNLTTVGTLAQLELVSSSALAKGNASAVASGELKLVAGDVLRMFAIAHSSTAPWRADVAGSWFQVEFVRAA